MERQIRTHSEEECSTSATDPAQKQGVPVWPIKTATPPHQHPRTVVAHPTTPHNKQFSYSRMESFAPCSSANTEGTGRMLPQPANRLSLLDMICSLDIDSIHPSSSLLAHSFHEYGFPSSSTRPSGRSGLIAILDQAIRMIDDDDDLAQGDGGNDRQTRSNPRRDGSPQQ